MPKPPISFPPRHVCPGVADRRWRPHWLWVSVLSSLLLTPAVNARNACGDELDSLGTPADATEVLRDARVMIGGLPMCTLAYRSAADLAALLALYSRQWQAHPGVLQAEDSDGDGRDDTLWQASDRFSRRLAVKPTGAGHAVMISLMPLDTADSPPPEPYLPLPAGFEIEFQTRNAAGASVHAHTPLALAAAARALTQTLEAAGWQSAAIDRPSTADRQRLLLHRDGEALEAELLRHSGRTLLLAQRVIPGGRR